MTCSILKCQLKLRAKYFFYQLFNYSPFLNSSPIGNLFSKFRTRCTKTVVEWESVLHFHFFTTMCLHLSNRVLWECDWVAVMSLISGGIFSHIQYFGCTLFDCHVQKLDPTLDKSGSYMLFTWRIYFFPRAFTYLTKIKPKWKAIIWAMLTTSLLLP